MMTYTAIDGHVIESSPLGPVYYSCDAVGYPDEVVDSFETTYADTVIGIQQIKINRVVVAEFMTLTITESTDEELLAYIAEVEKEPVVEEPVVEEIPTIEQQ